MGDKNIIALSRLMTLRQQLDNVARNVANQSTPGFKMGQLRFQEYLTKASEDDIVTAPRRSLVAATPFVDFAQGALMPTGNPLDTAIVDDAFFMVETSAGQRYTRVGAFTLDNKGRLVTLGGLPVVTSVGPLIVTERDTRLSVGPGGSISTEKGTLAKLRLVRFTDMRDLVPEGGGLFSSGSLPADVPAAEVKIATGVLEQSNVRPMVEMSRLLAATRSYEQMAQLFLKDDLDEIRKLAGED